MENHTNNFLDDLEQYDDKTKISKISEYIKRYNLTKNYEDILKQKQWLLICKEDLRIAEIELKKITDNKKTTGTNDYLNALQWVKNRKERLLKAQFN